MIWSKSTVPQELSGTSPEQPADERAWVEQARAGDAEAFGQLCRLYEAPLLRYALSLGCTPSVAEDLTEETLVEAWKSLRRYNGSCRLFTWICAILLNRHRNFRRRQRWLWFVPGDRELDGLAGSATAPDAAAEVHDEAALLRKCVAALPAKQQQVIFLRFYADDSLDGIAVAVGCSVGTVKSRLFHALERLRRMKALQQATCAPVLEPCRAASVNHVVIL